MAAHLNVFLPVLLVFMAISSGILYNSNLCGLIFLLELRMDNDIDEKHMYFLHVDKLLTLE